MTTIKYFAACRTAEDCKERYRELAKQYHPDLNPGIDDTEMKAINAEFDYTFKRLKDVHASTREGGEGETYTAEGKASTAEAPAEFMFIIVELLKLGRDITVELCGRWIWITGDTKAHKDELKGMGCRWASKKHAWFWHTPNDASFASKGKSLNDIRAKYGSQAFAAAQLEELAAAT